ncbi:uncharacterized protein LOC129581349 [Paramacrobiotus metropolitanus]|uniref:uncharacterized protein LOC129581349 n=1 Tax=Paramacrobiotus metropolitanus TaxID=2943436 RepID=UPI002446086F|nr:uncharacterized protein LOC129581349 [Paramacrobiotus metropolitanus]
MKRNLLLSSGFMTCSIRKNLWIWKPMLQQLYDNGYNSIDDVILLAKVKKFPDNLEFITNTRDRNKLEVFVMPHVPMSPPVTSASDNVAPRRSRSTTRTSNHHQAASDDESSGSPVSAHRKSNSGSRTSSQARNLRRPHTLPFVKAAHKAAKDVKPHEISCDELFAGNIMAALDLARKTNALPTLMSSWNTRSFWLANDACMMTKPLCNLTASFAKPPRLRSLTFLTLRIATPRLTHIFRRIPVERRIFKFVTQRSLLDRRSAQLPWNPVFRITAVSTTTKADPAGISLAVFHTFAVSAGRTIAPRPAPSSRQNDLHSVKLWNSQSDYKPPFALPYSVGCDRTSLHPALCMRSGDCMHP